MAKGKSISQKRKELDQKHPSKRAKLDLDSPIASLSSSSPKKIGLIKLNGPLPKVSNDAYINPIVKDLFLQVKTYQDFCLGAKVFWISYSAYCRGVSADQLDTLLELMSVHAGATWYEDDQYIQAWKKMYDFMVDFYMEKIKFYANNFLDSPAGKVFHSTTKKNRKAGKALPFLDVTSLHKFEGAEGITWGLPQTFDLFSILDIIAETDDCETFTDDYQSMSSSWFNFDVHQDAKPKQFYWVDKLASISSSLIIQWIRIHCGFAQPGGGTYEPSDNTLRTLLSHIPTEGDGRTFPPFHVEFTTLEEWRNYQDEQYKIPTTNDITVTYMLQDIKKIANLKGSLSSTILNQAITDSQSHTQNLANSYKAAIHNMPTNPLHNLSADDMTALTTADVPPFQLPSTKLYADELTPTDYAFITGNTQTKIIIALALAEQEIEGWDMLASQCTRRLAELEESRQKLEKKRALIKESQRGSLKFHKMFRQTASQVDEAQQEIDTVMANPFARTLIERKIPKTQIPFGSPQTLSNPNQGRQSPGFHALNSSEGQSSPLTTMPTAAFRNSHFSEPSPPAQNPIQQFDISSTHHQSFPTNIGSLPVNSSDRLLPSPEFGKHKLDSKDESMEMKDDGMNPDSNRLKRFISSDDESEEERLLQEEVLSS